MILVVSSPHLVLGHCGELHAYSTIIISVFIICYLAANYYKKMSIDIYCLLIFVISAVSVDFHKWYYINEQGLKGYRLAKKIDIQQITKPDSVYILFKAIDFKPYSVFSLSNYSSFGYSGEAYKWINSYKYPMKAKTKFLKANDFKTDKIYYFIKDSLCGMRSIWIIDLDRVLVIDFNVLNDSALINKKLNQFIQ
jgi:hypothetical protein